MNTPDKFSFYKEHPKTCEPDDFWGQVMRTVNGKPVGEEQIQMIIDSVISTLEITESDVLLDLCCGNGALTDRLFKVCQGGFGVDFSEPLIDTARRYFQVLPHRNYLLSDIEDYLRNTSDPQRFTKCLCYGSFMFLPDDKAVTVLRQIHSRFRHINRVYIGNLPDRERLSNFLAGRNLQDITTNDPSSPIGIWRTGNEFAELAGASGWRVHIQQMPDEFYAAAYRFDALLSREED